MKNCGKLNRKKANNLNHIRLQYPLPKTAKHKSLFSYILVTHVWETSLPYIVYLYLFALPNMCQKYQKCLTNLPCYMQNDKR